MKWLRNLFKPKKAMTPEPTADETFEQWFDRQGFKHFKAHEFTRYFHVNRYGVKNTPPPRFLWSRIVPTLRVVEEAREVIGKPIIVTSSYRSPVYNEACGGKSGSQHKQFTALDLQAKDTPPHELHKVLKSLRAAGKFKGGLGLYPTFVHVDTRGVNADW